MLISQSKYFYYVRLFKNNNRYFYLKRQNHSQTEIFNVNKLNKKLLLYISKQRVEDVVDILSNLFLMFRSYQALHMTIERMSYFEAIRQYGMQKNFKLK